MDRLQFRQYLIDLIASYYPGVEDEMADKILETLECHPEVVEKDPTDV